MHHKLHFPVALLKVEGNLILGAVNAHPAVAARLPDNYLTETGIRLDKVTTDVVAQKIVRGQLGDLTQEQAQALIDLKYYMSQARKTARLAFAGQTVKLHEQFQVGQPKKTDLPTVLQRADIILGSLKNADNVAALKAKAWAEADTSKFGKAREMFGEPEEYQEKAKADVMAATELTGTDAEDVYERLLTIQNAANLEFPALDPLNAPVRHEFRLGIFPPDSHSHHDPAPAPSTTTTATGTPTPG